MASEKKTLTPQSKKEAPKKVDDDASQSSELLSLASDEIEAEILAHILTKQTNMYGGVPGLNQTNLSFTYGAGAIQSFGANSARAA